jgi:putative flippase GtrA
MLRLSRSLARFVVVGSIGFVVDGGVMQLITWTTGVSPLLARAFSFPLALSVTWALNRTWTFETGRERAPLSQYRRYVAVQIAGFIINYAIFAGLVMTGGLWRDWPLLALAVGALISMIFTYVLSRLHVFSATP